MLLILNDIGGFEILLILGVILVFFGSKSIPSMAKTFGRTIRQVKEASDDIRSEIKKSANEMKGEMDLKGLIQETAEDVRRPLDQYAQDIDNAVKYTPPRRVVAEVEDVEEATEVSDNVEVTPSDQAKPVEKPVAKPVIEKPVPKADITPSEEGK